MRRALTVITILAVASAAWASSYNIWFENATKKIRQDVTPVVRNSIAIKAAKNEFEPVQLVFKNTTSVTQSNIDVSFSNFTSAGLGSIPSSNVTIMREDYVNVTQVSNNDGATGLWPDILYPKVDAYYHEARNAFPFSVATGYVQPIWFDVFIPSSTPAGNYAATATITQGGSTLFTGTVNLTVWNFTIPATSSVPNRFVCGISNPSAGHYDDVYSHGGNTTIENLTKLYLKAGLRHRLSFTGWDISLGTWNGSSYPDASATRFNNTYGPYISPSSPTTEYGASSLTSLGMDMGTLYTKYINNLGHCTDGTTTTPADLITETTVRAQTIYNLLTPAQRALMSILPVDEPGSTTVACGTTLDFTVSKDMAAAIKAVGLKTRVTKYRRSELLDGDGNNTYWDVWQPFFWNVEGKDYDGTPYDRRSEYDADIAAGAKLWWYTGCQSAGCGTTSVPLYVGNPQYFVDYQGIYNRVFQWMMAKYGIQGETYYNVAQVYGADPWYSQLSYGDQGDGNFFYPGVPNTTTNGLPVGARGAHTPSIGGTHDIPIESIRLKMIREGYEDLEYYVAAVAAGKQAEALGIINNVVTTAQNFTHDEAVLYAARESLAGLITGASGGAESGGGAVCRSGGTVTGGVVR